jgi:dihydrofolate synthase / folylpolyglutamate synthase
MRATPPLSHYADTIRYLEDLTVRPILSREEAGLSRITTLLANLDHPERAFGTIQVAGTTGKGSTTTMAATILREAGYTTGSFTSPHLQSYRERIAVDGEPIAAAEWVDLLNRLLPILDRMEQNALQGYDRGRAAFLEVLWAMACLAFVDRGVQHAVVETGLGGRLDPTTANTAGVAVITNVSLDHVDRLGATVTAIATEKAGLIKPGQHVISAASQEAMAVIGAACERQHATLWRVGDEAEIRIIAEGAGVDAAISIQTPIRRHANVRLGLMGAHQWRNAACAVGAIDALSARTGLDVPISAVACGLAIARVPGRLELVDGPPQVLLDGAHNAAGAEALAVALRTLFCGRRVVLILGILGDKELSTITRLLSPLAAAIVVSEPPWKSRAGFAGAVVAEARRYCESVVELDDPAAALERARAQAGPGDLIVVAGSLYLVGAVRDILVPADAESTNQ